ncbi:hypothetical protein ACIRPR_15790 [Streptomyces griseoflavus]|uniref:hypothetical protein n=1 Tax=Streptomyces griseoflavus TaxID=35619 RepID=UPI00382523F6
MDRSRLEASISRALANRAANRPLVAEVDRHWASFRGRFAELVDAVDRLIAESAASAALSGDPDHALAAVEAWRRPAADGGPDRLDRLASRIRQTEGHLGAVRSRVDRDTVNVGVVGRTKAGKSTVLRAVSGLDGTVLPSHGNNPTTASRSWIHHRPNRAEALVTLRTWDEFVDQYLAPLHAAAQLPAGPPRDPASFRDHPYPQVGNGGAPSDEYSAVALPYLRKLRQAQASLDDYLHLLTRGGGRGDTGEQIVVRLEELAPYISYPDGVGEEAGMPRLYHAVRDIHVYCDFPHVETTAMVLVDLPGAGEAGLDVQQHFLRDLTHEVDFLLHVKRAASNTAFFGQEDFADLHLAQLALGDVPFSDFAMVVVNPDVTLSPDAARNVLDSAREAARNYQVRTVECPLGGASETADHAVRELLLPVLLGHLADRLAEMDRAMLDGLRRRISAVTREALVFAGEVASAAERWQQGVPDEADRLQTLAEELCDELADELAVVYEEYDGMVSRNEHIPQIEAAVGEAAERVRAWVRDGFDFSDEAAWRARTKTAMYWRSGAMADRWFNRARTKLTEEFGGVDASVDRAVALLWQRMADSLRGRLTDGVVPTGDRPLEALLRRVERLPAPILRKALEDFTGLRTDYGSLFLRVGSPVVQQVRHVAGQVSPAVAPREPAGDGKSVQEDEQPPPGSRASWFQPLAAGRPGQKQPSPASAGAPAQPGASVQTAPAGSYAAGAVEGMEQLHRELVGTVEGAVSELERKLHTEALAMVRVLAAAAYQFFAATTGTPGVEREWRRVCRADQRAIWPGEFDGAEAALSESVSLLLKRADEVKTGGADLAAAVGGPQHGGKPGPGQG